MEAYEEDSEPGFQDSDRVATDKNHHNDKRHRRSPKSLLRGIKHSIQKAFGKKTKKSNQNNKQQDQGVSETRTAKSKLALSKESPETDVTQSQPNAMSVGIAMASSPKDKSRLPKYAHISADRHAISADSPSTTDSKHTPSEQFLERVEAEAAQIQAKLSKLHPDVTTKDMNKMPEQHSQQQEQFKHRIDGADSETEVVHSPANQERLDSPRTVVEDVSSAHAGGGNTQEKVDHKRQESQQFLQCIEAETAEIQAGLNQLHPRHTQPQAEASEQQTREIDRKVAESEKFFQRIEAEAVQVQAGLNQQAPRQRQQSVVSEELTSTEAERLIGCVRDSVGHVKDRVIESARASVAETLVDAAGTLPTPLQQTVEQMTEPIEHAVEQVMGRITDTAIESMKEEMESSIAKVELVTRPARKAMELMYNLSFPIITTVYVGLFAGITMIYAALALLLYLPLKVIAKVFVGLPLDAINLVVTKRPRKE